MHHCPNTIFGHVGVGTVGMSRLCHQLQSLDNILVQYAYFCSTYSFIYMLNKLIIVLNVYNSIASKSSWNILHELKLKGDSSPFYEVLATFSGLRSCFSISLSFISCEILRLGMSCWAREFITGETSLICSSWLPVAHRKLHTTHSLMCIRLTHWQRVAI